MRFQRGSRQIRRIGFAESGSLLGKVCPHKGLIKHRHSHESLLSPSCGLLMACSSPMRIPGSNNDILFRTAEYLAAGYFHNSMITAIDHANRKLTFRYKSWVDRDTQEKFFSEMTLDIFEFMARLLH
jgi:hypothetical protein